jgi:hypothetical protein
LASVWSVETAMSRIPVCVVLVNGKSPSTVFIALPFTPFYTAMMFGKTERDDDQICVRCGGND